MKLGLTKEAALELAEAAVQRGADAAEVVLRQSTEFSVGVRLGDVEKLTEATTKGLGLRVLIAGRQASVSGSDFSMEAVLALLDEAIRLARATSPDESTGLPDPEDFARTFPDLDLYDEAIERLGTEAKIEMALRAERAAQSYSDRIINFDGGGLNTAYGSAVLANSLGFAGEYRGTSISLVSVPVASDGGKMQRDYWFDARRWLADLDAPEAIGAQAAARTLRKLNGRPVPSGVAPVVFDPNMAQDLLGDVLQAVSGEAIFRKSSFLVGRLGEGVASPHLTVIDDGTIKKGLGSRPFDDEGLPTRKTVVLEKGKLVSYLLNTYTARKLGLKSTGNAGRALVGAPTVEAGNFYIAPGAATPKAIIGAVKQGLYLTELIGYGVNIVTGDYSRSASGLWIENGELTFPVQGVTIAGNLKEMLNSIEMIGNDLDFRAPLVSPTLLIGRMTIGA